MHWISANWSYKKGRYWVDRTLTAGRHEGDTLYHEHPGSASDPTACIG